MAFGTPIGSKGRSASASSQATGAVDTRGCNTFFVGVAWENAGAAFTSLVDSVGNTYTQIGTELDPSGTGHARMYRCANGLGSAAHTATLTIGSAQSIEILFIAVPGGAGFDAGSGVLDTATPFASPSLTTTAAREMLVAFTIGNSGSNPATHAESTGFTIVSAAEETDGASFFAGAIATRTVTSIGTYNASFTVTGSTRETVFIAAFPEAPTIGAARIPFNPKKGPRVQKFRPAQRAYNSTPTSDVTVALTGQSYTYSAGTLTPSTDRALTGTQYAWSAGTLAPSTTAALAGSQYAWSAGTVTPSTTLALVGSLETYAAGTLAPSTTIELTGATYAWNTGTLTASTGGDVTVALTGQAYAWSAGTLTPSSTVALTGASSAYSTGTLAVDHAQPLTGVAEAYSTGILTPSTTISLAGELYLYSAGTLTAQAGGDVTVALTGVQYGWQAGTLTPSGGDSGQVGTGNGSGPFFPMARGIGYDKPKKPKKRKVVAPPEPDPPPQIIVKPVEETARPTFNTIALQNDMAALKAAVLANNANVADQEAIEALFILLAME